MRTVSLASGSKGNSIFIEAGSTRLLVDLGLTCSSIEERLSSIGVDPKTIKGILVTHEHSDHVAGIDVFARKYKTIVYVHQNCFPCVMHRFSKIPQSQIVCFVSDTFFVEDVKVTAAEVPHNSSLCLSFSFEHNGKKASVVTDCGHMKDGLLKHLARSDILYIEANHDEEMLMANENYSLSLKNNILSPKGHLSNLSCGVTLTKLVRTGVKQVILSHLSEENNTPELAYLTIKNILLQHGIEEGKHIFVDVAMQHTVGNIFEI